MSEKTMADLISENNRLKASLKRVKEAWAFEVRVRRKKQAQEVERLAVKIAREQYNQDFHKQPEWLKQEHLEVAEMYLAAARGEKRR